MFYCMQLVPCASGTPARLGWGLLNGDRKGLVVSIANPSVSLSEALCGWCVYPLYISLLKISEAPLLRPKAMLPWHPSSGGANTVDSDVRCLGLGHCKRDVDMNRPNTSRTNPQNGELGHDH